MFLADKHTFESLGEKIKFLLLGAIIVDFELCDEERWGASCSEVPVLPQCFFAIICLILKPFQMPSILYRIFLENFINPKFHQFSLWISTILSIEGREDGGIQKIKSCCHLWIGQGWCTWSGKPSGSHFSRRLWSWPWKSFYNKTMTPPKFMFYLLFQMSPSSLFSSSSKNSWNCRMMNSLQVAKWSWIQRRIFFRTWEFSVSTQTTKKSYIFTLLHAYTFREGQSTDS